MYPAKSENHIEERKHHAEVPVSSFVLAIYSLDIKKKRPCYLTEQIIKRLQDGEKNRKLDTTQAFSMTLIQEVNQKKNE